MKLEGKTVVLTGGTSGIGLEVLKKVIRRNRVIVLSRKTDVLKKLDLPLGNLDLYDCDLSKDESVDEIADKILKKYDEIDVLINNAAIQITPQFLQPDFSLESIKREITVNFSSVCRLTYHFLPALLKDSRSIILNVNSGLALAPKTSSAVYCATKSALNTFSISLGYQLEKTNIRVLQAFMPLVDTPMTEGRGTRKISPAQAAAALLAGLEKERPVTNVGKVKILRILQRISPGLASRIMKQG